MRHETSEASAKAGPGVLHAREPGSYSKKAAEKQSDWGEYPDAPGFKWTDTSREAAEAIAPRLGRLQRLALDAITDRAALGLTADELADVLELDRYSIQPRTSELRRKSLIVDSGLRRLNASRKKAIVWVAPQFKRGVA
jgi:hypothetical protein